MVNHLQKTLFLFLIAAFGLNLNQAFSQIMLDADGPGNTYELINSVFAPGYDAVENPECVHPEFGRHIAEVWDEDLKQFVFEFYIHVTPDNDRCINFDRQRIEIKTYDSSPENLKGVPGEVVTYKWKFKLPAGFKPSTSFTHIHQIKAVGGDDDNPIFTLTPRLANPNRIELIHNNTTKVATAPMSLFENVWVEVTEKIKIDNLHGTYSMTIKKVSDGTILLSYSNSDLMTIRADNIFIRPKWGIYRSLTTPSALRDESMRFAGFSISEGSTTSTGQVDIQDNYGFQVFPNPACTKAVLDCKHTNFEQATHAPLLISAPGIKPSKTKSPSEFIDIFPTLCDLTGVAVPEHLDGKSLVPMMKDPKVSVKDFAVSQYPRTRNKLDTERLGWSDGQFMGYTIRTTKYRYTIWLKNNFRSNQPFSKDLLVASELYDYEKDPNEPINVVDEKGYSVVSKDMYSKMLGILKSQEK